MTEMMMPEEQREQRAIQSLSAAAALLGVGVAVRGPLPATFNGIDDLELWIKEASAHLSSADNTRSVQLDPSAMEAIRSLSERDRQQLADRWNALQLYRPRFAVRDGSHAASMIDVLSRSTERQHFAFIERPRKRPLVPWRWPIDVALLSTAGGAELFDRLAELRQVSDAYLSPLLLVSAVDRATTADILLLRPRTMNVSDVIAEIRRPPRAGLVLCLSDERTIDSPSAPAAWQQRRALEQQFPASAVAWASVGDEMLQDWLEGFLRELSHNEPVDVALTLASERLGLPPGLLSAPAGFVQHARLEHAVDALQQRLESAAMPPTPMTIPTGSRASAMLGVEQETSTDAVAEKLRSVPRDSGFARETGLATVSMEIDEAAPRTPVARFLQAKLQTKAHPPVDLPTWTAGVTNVLSVRVGPRDSSWLTPSAAREFPVDEVLGEQEVTEVTVLCFVPGILTKALRRKMTVRRIGPSTLVRFPITVPDTLDRVTARIVVTHGGRVVQSGQLSGPVRRDDSVGGQLDSFELDTVLRSNIGDLRSRQLFEASLLIEAGSTVIHDIDRARTFNAPPILSALLDHYDRQLTDVARNPAKYEGGLDSPACTDLLRELAQTGSLVRDTLEEQGLSPDLFCANRIQLVSTTTSIRLPVELFYDGLAPLPEAMLCPDWKAGLTSDGCGAACPADGGGDAVICPRRFWGFSRIIERHVEGTSSRTWNGDFAVRAEPDARAQLRVFRATAVAGSDRVTKFDAAGLLKLRDRLEQQDGVANHHRFAENWNQWETAIESASPSLLVLLPHTSMQGIQPQMEIGGTQKLLSNLESRHIGSAENRPIVILLGCETDTNPTQFFDIVGRCRRRGAVIVIAFGATIAVKHALPAAEQLLDQLAAVCRSGNSATLGDAMLATRRALAAGGWVAALGLAAYGDADWKLTS